MNLYLFVADKRKLDKVISHSKFSYHEKKTKYINGQIGENHLINYSLILGENTDINNHKQKDRKKVESDI